MGKGKQEKEFKITAAYSMEKSTVPKFQGGGAFPVLNTFGLVQDGIELSCLNGENVEAFLYYYQTHDPANYLEGLILRGKMDGYVPVVMVHGMTSVMFALAGFLNAHNIEVFAKGELTPMTLKVMGEEGPELCLWDTSYLFDGSEYDLARAAGCEFGGYWNFDGIYTPSTDYSPDELEFSKSKVRALFAYLGYFLRMNPFILPSDLGFKVLTKTSVVRQDRKDRFYDLKAKGKKKSVGGYWRMASKVDQPKSDDELFTNYVCTRGGFSFVAAEYCSRNLDFELTGEDKRVIAYDAQSHYPAQIVAHKYPQHFKPMTAETLQDMADWVLLVGLDDVLDDLAQPFIFGFDGLFEFENLRPREGSVFARDGIYTLTRDRFSNNRWAAEEGRTFNTEFANALKFDGYKDIAENPTFSFGKLERADSCSVWLTEIELWIMGQVYDFDRVKAICGYGTMSYTKPTDMSVLSVMAYYKEKAAFKRAREAYYTEGRADCKGLGFVPEWLSEQMKAGTADIEDVEHQYRAVKERLNSLFGIEITNEARPPVVFGEEGPRMGEGHGIEDLPERPQSWYQMGQRVAAWGRLAQIVCIELAGEVADGVVCGDTDSLKLIVRDGMEEAVAERLKLWGDALAEAKEAVTVRVRDQFPCEYSELEGIGYYMEEYETKKFYAGWNKGYAYELDGEIQLVIAGVKAATRSIMGDGEVMRDSYQDLANNLYQRRTFGEVCSLVLGYNVTIDKEIAKACAREFPKYGETVEREVTDCNGKTAHVKAYATVAEYPIGLTLNCNKGDMTVGDMMKAKENNGGLHFDDVVLSWTPGERPIMLVIDEWEGPIEQVL